MNFSSSIPDIYLSKIEINNSNIDVIKIKNSQNKPYFLLKDYTRDGKRISRGVIYTRNGDSNTPIDATASHHEYEALWREHFGIHLSGIDRMKALLSQTDLWEGDCEQRIFHKFFPEYHIKFSQPQAITIDGQYFSYYYHSMNTSHFFASMFYHTIEFFKISCFCCDEARVRFPGPNTGSLPFIKDSYFYFYYKCNRFVTIIWYSRTSTLDDWNFVR